ncbi:MAG: ATP-binding protein [bacterium]|nr:ATP-binding protein [bacterium]
MNSLIEQIIADFHERELPDLTARKAELPRLSGKIDAVIGMRRTGKTYFLYEIMKEYLADGAPKSSMLYINFDDERLYPMTTADLHGITDTFYRLFPKNKERLCYLFFDEIQNIPGWEQFVRRILDTEKVQMVLTGSSAKLLSREISTSLRGRSISTEIFPFSFHETLTHEGIQIETAHRPGAKLSALLQNRFRSFLIKGGFPEIQGLDDFLRLRILQEYVDVVILRDIVERYRIGNIQPLRALIRHLLSAPSTLFSVNKFYNDLKSQGIACGKNTLHEFLEHLSDAYLFYPAVIHSRSERARRVNPRKIYAIDTGLITAFMHQPDRDTGRLLENAVFMELRRRCRSIEYYRTESGFEVDFIATTASGNQALYQVSLHLNDPVTRKRELRALTEAMEETGIGKGMIITLEDEEHIETDCGPIEAIPAWLWMINMEPEL